MREVIAAVLEAGDLDEDAAASLIVETHCDEGWRRQNPPPPVASTSMPSTPGCSRSMPVWSTAVNAIDPAITLATLADKVAVEKGQMVATVKIIPFAVDRRLVEEACETLVAGRSA